MVSNGDQASLIDQTASDNASLDRDNKLLNFSAPSYYYALLDYTYRRIPVVLSAQLHGMFFLAEPIRSGNGELISAPGELTCYRRNLFSISGSLTLPRSMRYILTDQGEQMPIVNQELELSATESVEGNPVKIISVPWKTPAGAGPPPEEKMEKEPPALPLDLISGSEMDPDYATIPIAWKRLQFRIATANNGRRRELQQHFNVRIRLMATLSTGQRTSVCEVTSGSIIVRGRSPRNFQAKKEVPVGTSSASNRRSYTQKSPTNENPTSAPPISNAPVKAEQESQFDTSFIPPDFLDLKSPDHGAMTALPANTFSMPPPAQVYAQSSPDISRKPSSKPTPAPINLSLADDEPKKRESSSETPPAKRSRTLDMSSHAPSFPLRELSENDEPADLLYEYFPLGLDDWQEPVDAVYRPHVVHHINIPGPKTKNQANRSKRYFSSKEAANH